MSSDDDDESSRNQEEQTSDDNGGFNSEEATEKEQNNNDCRQTAKFCQICWAVFESQVTTITTKKYIRILLTQTL